jgi:hypothetical protein
MAEGVRIASPIDAGLFCPLPNSPGNTALADVAITMRVYARFLESKKQDTLDDLERFIKNG